MKKIVISKSLKSFFVFGLVGGTGAVVNTFFLYILTSFAGLFYLVASLIATEIAILSNFFGNNLITFKNHKGKKGYIKLIQFQIISISTIFGTLFLLFLLTTTLGKSYLLIWNLISIGIMSIANYFLNTKFTWKKDVNNPQKIVLEKVKLLERIPESRAIFYKIDSKIDKSVLPPIEIAQAKKLKFNNYIKLIILFSVSFIFLLNLGIVSSNITENNTLGNLDNLDNFSIDQFNYTGINLTNFSLDNLTYNNGADTINSSINNSENNFDYNYFDEINNSQDNSSNISTIEINNTYDSFTNNTNEDLMLKLNVNDTKEINSSSVVVMADNLGISLVAISQLGYHPNGTKQVIVYTNKAEGKFNILKSGNSVFNGNLYAAKDAFGNNVLCQGKQPCLVGDFSNFSVEGNYILNATDGANTPSFTISKNVYKNNVPILFEFFNAMQQQNSDYHADFHSGYNPEFLAMADGSFIMEASQASKTLIRLSSAYRRNPSLFEDTQNKEVIKSYTDYLMSLQGLKIQNMSPSDNDYKNGFRLNALVKINNIFYPGPVPNNIKSMNVYSSPGSISDSNVPVTSLCGEGFASNLTWKACIDYAANYYKCQIDEPCVNATYMEKTGKVIENYETSKKFGVSTGWSVGQEFGCFVDADLENGIMNDKINPCFMFLTKEDPEDTASTLLGFLQALPALNDADPIYAQKVFDQSVATYNYIKQNDAAYWQNSNSLAVGYIGASEFLLYDYTKNVSYLKSAYSMRNKVDTVLISDATHGNEFYWEEYIRHKEDINNLGLTYNYLGSSPEELVYQGTLWQVWKDRLPNSISQSGERVFQFDNRYSGDPNERIQFQSSRYILTMGIIASKTRDFDFAAQDFDKIIADNQLAWMTGMNSVQNGVSLNSTKRSYSFIFGIGTPINPNEFHSRYLINTGFKESSNSNPLGQVAGVRGSDKQFFNGTNYIYLDGTFNILDTRFGSPGNGYRNETKTILWSDQTFTNGKTIIAGWTNGAFDNFQDSDTIWNYDDDRQTYEYTESTNEIVASAIELFAYSDAKYNDRTRHKDIYFNNTNLPAINNTNNSIMNGTLFMISNPFGALLYVDGNYAGNTPLNISLVPGSHITFLTLSNYTNDTRSVIISQNTTTNVAVTLSPLNITNGTNTTNTTNQNGTLNILTNPTNALVSINGINYSRNFNTPLNISLNGGNYTLFVSKNGYSNISTSINIVKNQTLNLIYNLTNNSVSQNVSINGTIFVDSFPSGALVSIAAIAFTTPGSISLSSGNYTLNVSKEGYNSKYDNITIINNQTLIKNYTLIANNSNINNSTNQTNVTNVNIVSSSTSLAFATNSSTGSIYEVFEADKSYFNITLSSNASVIWSIDGIEYNITKTGNKHSMIFDYDILFTSNVKQSIIKASVGNSSVSWKIDVYNLINPFFSPDVGSSGTTLFVYTNNDKVIFKSIIVNINNKQYNLTNKSVPNDETEWSIFIPNIEFICGGNDIQTISAKSIDNVNNYTESLPINARGFQKNCPSSAGNSGSSEGSGGSSDSSRDDFSLIYVIFDKEVVAASTLQFITLDAKNSNRISNIEAIILEPNGKKSTLKLIKVSGTNYYGTWSANITNVLAGLYILEGINMHSAKGSKNFSITDRSFYVLGDNVSSNENLEIVYTLLDKSRVETISNVTLTLDARDVYGVENISATIQKIHGNRINSFSMPLNLVEGTKTYGTWKGLFEVNEGDTTYSVVNITLYNSNSSKTHFTSDRIVYATDALPLPLEDDFNSFITGNIISRNFSTITKSPFLLTIVALAVVALISLSFLIRRNLSSSRSLVQNK